MIAADLPLDTHKGGGVTHSAVIVEVGPHPVIRLEGGAVQSTTLRYSLTWWTGSVGVS